MWRKVRFTVRLVPLVVVGFVFGRYTGRCSVNVGFGTAPAAAAPQAAVRNPRDTAPMSHPKPKTTVSKHSDDSSSFPPPPPPPRTRIPPGGPPPSASLPPPPGRRAGRAGRTHRDFPDKNKRRAFENSPEGLAARLKESRDELDAIRRLGCGTNFTRGAGAGAGGQAWPLAAPGTEGWWEWDGAAALALDDVVFFVRSTEQFHAGRTVPIHETWGRTAMPSLAYVTDGGADALAAAIAAPGHVFDTSCGSTHGYRDLCCKTRWQLQYWRHLIEDCGSEKRWFCHVDDDTYVLVRNVLVALGNLDATTSADDKRFFSFSKHLMPFYCLDAAAVRELSAAMDAGAYEEVCHEGGVPDDNALERILPGNTSIRLAKCSTILSQWTDLNALALGRADEPTQLQNGRRRKLKPCESGGFKSDLPLNLHLAACPAAAGSDTGQLYGNKVPLRQHPFRRRGAAESSFCLPRLFYYLPLYCLVHPR